MTRSLHPIERLLQQLQIARLAKLFAHAVDPLFLERIFGRLVIFIEDAEHAVEVDVQSREAKVEGVSAGTLPLATLKRRRC